MADVNITVDGKKVTAPAGTLLIEACKSVGIEVPSFCYYPNLSLQGACRMCLVKIEKMPKLQTACTTVISEGMAVTTDSDEIRQARKSMVELLLGNHPLDCPVCDAGGECELQDMTFSYGAAESKYIDAKNHKEEQQWSPVVFFDRPRCILVLSLRAGVWRRHGCLGSGRAEPRRQFDHRAQSRRSSGMRRVRHVHRHMPGGRADFRRVSLQDASLGDEARGHDLHPLRRRLQDHAGRAPIRYRHGDCARRQSRQERHQRRFSLHQGPLRLRFRASRRPADAAVDPQEWALDAIHLGRSV